MTHVATFRASSPYPNQRVVFDNETFTIEGSGAVDLRILMQFAASGDLEWVSQEMRDWANQRANAMAVASPGTPAAVAAVPRAKPFYKRAWFIALAAVAVLGACGLCAIIGALGDSSPETPSATQAGASSDDASPAAAPVAEEPADSPDEPTPAEEQPTEEPAQYGIGDTVPAGKFDYTVNGLSSTNQLGEEPFSMTTEGEFLLVNVTIKNNDTEGRVMDTTMFTLRDSQGNEYDADPSAFMYLDSQESFFLDNVNPGLARTGDIVFEVPAGLTGLSLEVDSGVLFAAGESVVIELDR